MVQNSLVLGIVFWCWWWIISLIIFINLLLSVESIELLQDCDSNGGGGGGLSNASTVKQDFPTVTVSKLSNDGEEGRWDEQKKNDSISFLKVSNSTPLDSLELVCSASYPIQWGFNKYPLWIPWSASTGREFLSVSQGNGEKFKAWLRYPSIRNITQLRNDFPTCHKTTDLCFQTSISVGNDNGKELLVIHKGSKNSLKPNEEFGENANCSLRMGYDKSTQTFYCQSTLPNSNVTMFPRHCSDPVNCASIYQEPDMICPTVEPMIPLNECNLSGCARLTFASNFLPSVAICLIRGLEESYSVAAPYFYSLPVQEDKKPTRYLNWAEVKPEDMIALSNSNKSLFAGDSFSLHCNASYYYFGSGMYFEIEPIGNQSTEDGLKMDENMEDSENLLPKSHYRPFNSTESILYQSTTGKGVETQLPIIRSLIANENVIRVPGTYLVFCKAPVWNSTEWISKSSILTVLESTKPMFSTGNKTETLYYKPDSSLNCMASGVPKPQMTWSLDDHTLPPGIRTYVVDQNDTRSWVTLQFPNSARGIYGNFTCTASNAGGVSRKTFIIIPNDKSSSTPLIIIAILGVLGLFLIPAVLFLFWKVRQQKKQLRYLTQDEIDEFLLGKPDYIPFQCDMSTYAYYLPYDTTFEIPKEDLKIDFNRVLGSGAYGMVIFGHYNNTSVESSSPESKEVAVKTSKPLEDGIDLFKALLSELKIMAYIGKHHNIVNLIGACTQNIQKREVFIALEFCENGSLLSYLRTHRHTFYNPGFQGDDDAYVPKSPLSRQPSFLEHPQVQYVKMEDLSHIAILNQTDYSNVHKIARSDLLRWSLQIADGMTFLVSKKVIHGDLAARNVLLTKNRIAKIGDFGLSKRLMHYNSYTRTATTPLPIKWLAIECLTDFQFSAESDIWSYGVTLWEIFSLGEIPYSGFNGTGEEFLKRLSRGMRLVMPTYSSPETFEIMMSCWKHDRKQRPGFEILSQYFKKCLETQGIFSQPAALLTNQTPTSQSVSAGH